MKKEQAMREKKRFGPESLVIDAAAEAEAIARRIREYIARTRKKGAVVALSGGIDSSVTAFLCVKALGKEKVFGLHMPEKESSSETIKLSRSISDSLGI